MSTCSRGLLSSGAGKRPPFPGHQLLRLPPHAASHTHITANADARKTWLTQALSALRALIRSLVLFRGSRCVWVNPQSILSAMRLARPWLSQGQICSEGKECVFYSGRQH